MRHALMSAAVWLTLIGSAQAQSRYAVLVGVSQYRHQELPDLKYTENDVTALAELLRGQGYDEVIVLTDTEGKLTESRKPTKANIDATIKAILKKCQRGDTVFVALAGHGLQFGDIDDAFFCPWDAQPVRTRPETLISLKNLYDELNSFKGVKIVMVDACRDDPDRTRGTRGVDADTSPRPPDGVAALFSCSAGERAFERDDIEHGVFFHYVLKGMRGEAKDFDDEVTFLGLANYVKKRVQRHVETEVGGGASQSPDVVEEPRGSLVLVRPAREIIETFRWKGEDRTRRVRVLDLGGGERLELIRIPKGTFLMGAPDSDEDAHNDEKPRHEVEFTDGFYIGKYEVTRGQFARLVAETGYRTDAERDGEGGWGFDQVTGEFDSNPKYTWLNSGMNQTDRDPVVNVSWNDAKRFCVWVENQTGMGVGLPTEAQWEYACRAGTTTSYITGDAPDSLKGYANIGDATYQRMLGLGKLDDFTDGVLHTHPVGRLRPNAFGLYDVTGNVAEWCEDWYQKDLYTTEKRVDPEGPRIGSHRVFRGGSKATPPDNCRLTYRRQAEPESRFSDLGFRVVFSSPTN